MNRTIRIESIAQVHKMLGVDNPGHPLVSLIESSRQKPIQPTVPITNVKFVSELYSISLKNGQECGIKYGRENYDFQQGSLIFLAPGQSVTPVTEPGELENEGDSWSLLFHPDLIRQAPLASRMREYSFFSYDSHEALHLSDKERQTVSEIANKIKEEYSQNIDVHSHELIVSNLELLLNYCKRYYGRQFITRASVSVDVVVRFEAFLQDYFSSDTAEREGLPTVQSCARAMGYSPNYLSDLLKKETGTNTRDHIHYFMIAKAKELLLGSEETISAIAYSLGFKYPQHFSKLFKTKTGLSPAKYRN